MRNWILDLGSRGISLEQKGPETQTMQGCTSGNEALFCSPRCFDHPCPVAMSGAELAMQTAKEAPVALAGTEPVVGDPTNGCSRFTSWFFYPLGLDHSHHTRARAPSNKAAFGMLLFTR